MEDIDKYLLKCSDSSIRYAIVVESEKRGYVLMLNSIVSDAKFIASKIFGELEAFEDADIHAYLRDMKPIIEYSVYDNTSIITKTVWIDFGFQCNVYVIPINYECGNLSQFVKERQHCSDLISWNEYNRKYERAVAKFKPYVFTAN